MTNPEKDTGRIDPFVPMTFEQLIEARKDLSPHEEGRLRQAEEDAKDYMEKHGFGGGGQFLQMVAYQSHGGSAFMQGPCVSLAVKCGCTYAGTSCNCEWCEGSGWLTQRVRALQIIHNLQPAEKPAPGYGKAG